MPGDLFDQWCESEDIAVAQHKLHVLLEKEGARAAVGSVITTAVAAHYDDPKQLSARFARLGYVKAAAVLREMLPQTKRARSGHLGEILATEAVPAFLSSFEIPVKRLRWTDGRESALRGEDLIGIERDGRSVRFLKGESKSRLALTPSVVAEARHALTANNGRPSQHALGFIMKLLFDQQRNELAMVFEEYMLRRSIPTQQLVHLTFTLSGNDASDALKADLMRCGTEIEQHTIAMRIPDHQNFIKAVYESVNTYAP